MINLVFSSWRWRTSRESNLEALMYASGNNDNLIATIDYNKRQIDGDISDVLPLGNLKRKLESLIG